MRTALIEMIHPDAVPADTPIPPEGAIEEAVKTAKTYAAAAGAVLREWHPGGRPPETRQNQPR